MPYGLVTPARCIACSRPARSPSPIVTQSSKRLPRESPATALSARCSRALMLPLKGKTPPPRCRTAANSDVSRENIKRLVAAHGLHRERRAAGFRGARKESGAKAVAAVRCRIQPRLAAALFDDLGDRMAAHRAVQPATL